MACIKRKRGRWVVDFYDQNGNRREKWTPKGANKTQAKKLLREIEDQIARGIYLPEKKIPTFSEVAKDWLEHKKPNLRDSTWSVYEGHTRNHFHDLEQIKVSRITTAKIEKFITDRQKQSMHIDTLRKVLVSLGQIMSYAARHGYINHNPFHDAEKPKGKGKTKKQKIGILTPTEINTLVKTVSNKKYQILFRLAIFSGARQGELLGFRWSDVDWKNNQIHIQRTFNHHAWYDVKTETSDRKIDLGPEMMTELKKWKLACPRSELDLVFPNQSGNPICHNNMLKRHFNPALKAAGLPKIRFHDLRHTYASLLIDQGENIKYIQNQLGHSTPTVTLNVYAHLMKPVNQEAACRLEKQVFEKNGDLMETNPQKKVTV
jgi:integrase